MKAPAFQFYAADFLADKNVAVMSAPEVGVYILLISYCWREGALPDDMEELAALSRLPVEQFTKSWERRIGRCFIQRAEDGQWIHPRLEAERMTQAANREKKRHAANVRHHPGAVQTEGHAPRSDNADVMHTDSTRNADERQAQCPSSSSSSSSAREEHPAANAAGAGAPSDEDELARAHATLAERGFAVTNDKSPPRKPPDTVWGLGVQMLVSSGMTEANARTYLGSLSKKHGKETLAQAISSTSAQNPVNPSEYLVKVLEGAKNATPGTYRNGDRPKRPGLAEQARKTAEHFGLGGKARGAG